MMLPKKLTPDTANEFRSVIEAMPEDANRLWGELSIVEAIAHLRKTFEISLGLEETKDFSTPVVREVLYFLFFRVFTKWPESKFKAPAVFFPEVSSADFLKEKEELLALLDKFIEAYRRDSNRKVLSPLLGVITLERWAHVHAVHMNHHLRQFSQIN